MGLIYRTACGSSWSLLLLTLAVQRVVSFEFINEGLVVGSLSSTPRFAPSGCKYEHTKVECNGVIPDSVSDGIEEIILTQIDQNELVSERFCNVTWDKVTKLAVEIYSDVGLFDLDNGIFKCLGQLNSLKVSGKYLGHFSNQTFSNLANITKLELTGTYSLFWDDLIQFLSLPTSFPKLSHLNLSLNYPNVVFVGQRFIDSLAGKPIKILDLSYNNLDIYFSNASALCKTLTTLIVHDTYTLFSDPSLRQQTCKSLRILDLSRNRAAVHFYKNFRCVNLSILSSLGSGFYGSVQVLYFNRFVTAPDRLYMSDCQWHLFNNTSVRELHITQNNIPNFDTLLINDRLEFINLSDNEIQNIFPKALVLLSSLSKIDLSHNALYKIPSFGKTFSILFKYNHRLTSIDLSFNRLSYLPSATFSANENLQELYLSNNLFHQTHFNISHIMHLIILDVRCNEISSLDTESRRLLDIQQQLQTSDNATINVLLTGNPLSCQCPALDFLQWFSESLIFVSVRQSYYCSIGDQKLPIDDRAIRAAQDDCARAAHERQVLLLSTIIPVSSSAFIVISLLYLYKRIRKRKLAQRHTDRIRLFQEDNLSFRFLVFLSYSSEDKRFVNMNILQPLELSLNAITNVDRDLICFADKHFVPGRTILSEMVRCLEESAVFIAVLSTNYCRSGFCRFEIDQAHQMGKPIILIFKEHVDENEMSQVIKDVFHKFARAKCVFEMAKKVFGRTGHTPVKQ